MEIGIFDLESAINWNIKYLSNNNYIDAKVIRNSIKNNYFPIISYLYSNKTIKYLNNSEYFEKNKIIEKIDKNIYRINDIPNKILVEVREDEKLSKDFPKLAATLKKEKIKLEKIIDIEFFEYYEIHHKYLKNLNGKQEIELEKYEDKKKNSFPSQKDVIKYFNQMENKHFEDSLINQDPTILIDILDDDLFKIDSNKFSTFMDTEKIHIQLAICSKGNKKNIPILAYFGFGNYYPFIGKIKDKNKRFNRFSQINSTDNVSSKYYLNEFNKSNSEKERTLKKLIDESQLLYSDYFQETFDLKNIKELFESKYNEKCEFPLFVDDLIMLQPIFRGKSAALIANDYKFFK